MPKRSSKQSGDTNEVATRVVHVATGDGNRTSLPRKNPAAVALGKLGGRKGGAARAKKLTKEQRVQIARKAAQARWGKETRHEQRQRRDEH